MKEFKIRLINIRDGAVLTNRVKVLTFAEAHVSANRLRMETSSPYDWKIEMIQEVEA